MADEVDAELLGLVNRIKKVQQEFGGADEKGKQEHVNSIGGIDEDGKADRFNELKDTIEERLQTLKELIEGMQAKVRQGAEGGTANAKEIIVSQAKIRAELMALDGEYREIESIHKAEARKKKSRFTTEEMNNREMVLALLQVDIQSVRDVQRTALVKGYQSIQLPTFADSAAFSHAKAAGGGGYDPDAQHNSSVVFGGRNNEMNDQHRMALKQIKRRDQEIDEEIAAIGEGVDMLHHIATTANEAVKVQNVILADLEVKMEAVGTKALTVNQRLKVSLDDTRGSDKIAMDVCCVLVLIGLIIALVQVAE